MRENDATKRAQGTCRQPQEYGLTIFPEAQFSKLLLIILGLLFYTAIFTGWHDARSSCPKDSFIVIVVEFKFYFATVKRVTQFFSEIT